MIETRERLCERNGGTAAGLELAAADGSFAIVLGDEPPTNGLLVLYDQDGLLSCERCASADMALEIAYGRGYQTMAQGSLQRLSRSERWLKGMRKPASMLALLALGPDARRIKKSMGLNP